MDLSASSYCLQHARTEQIHRYEWPFPCMKDFSRPSRRRTPSVKIVAMDMKLEWPNMRRLDVLNMTSQLLPLSVSEFIFHMPLAVAKSANPIRQFSPIACIGLGMLTSAVLWHYWILLLIYIEINSRLSVYLSIYLSIYLLSR